MATDSVIIWKMVCHFFSVVLDGILFILTGNDDVHKRLNEFEIQPDPTTDHIASCPLASKKFMFTFFLALYNGSQVSIVALWATCLLFEHIIVWFLARLYKVQVELL